jgi:very-short-patch-repair endonuclease
MKQPTKNNISLPIIKNKKKQYKTKKFNKSSVASELDGSGLETFFRINILDKLGVKYDQQFEAKSIGRFYDFHLKDKDNNSLHVLLEIDGSFFHSDPSIYKDNLTIIQKRNKRVDKIKDTWALINGYVLIRILESDIRKDPANVMLKLSERLNIQTEAILLAESKKNGSFFMKKK